MADDFDPIGEIQQVLARIDPEAMVTGFVAIIEWIEPDGSPNMSMLRTPMSPWHVAGLIDYAKSWEASETFPVYMIESDDGFDLEDDDGL